MSSWSGQHLVFHTSSDSHIMMGGRGGGLVLTTRTGTLLFELSNGVRAQIVINVVMKIAKQDHQCKSFLNGTKTNSKLSGTGNPDQLTSDALHTAHTLGWWAGSRDEKLGPETM